MENWMIIAAASVVVAIAAPLLVKTLGKRDPATLERERVRQRELLAQIGEILDGVAQTVREGKAVPIGVGSPVHDEMAKLRGEIRQTFTFSAASEFDREIGFELNRAGTLQIGPDALEARIQRAMQALRNAQVS